MHFKFYINFTVGFKIFLLFTKLLVKTLWVSNFCKFEGLQILNTEYYEF